MVIYYFNSLFAVTYDVDFARVLGLNTRIINCLVAILAAITIALGIMVVGTMLISSLIVFPTVTALQISKGFKFSIFIAATVAVVSVVFGVFSSYIFNLPTGATIVLFNGAFFLIAFLLRRLCII